MEPTKSTDESTPSGKQITEPKRRMSRRIAITVAAVVLSGSGLIVINNSFTFNIFPWTQSDDEESQPDDGAEVQSDGRSVQISWGADLSRDPDPDISGQCLDYVFCRDFNYELIGGFGPGPYTLECWLTHNDEPYFGPSSWPGPEDEDKKQRCRVRGNNELVAYVVVDGVKSNELRWTRADVGGEVQSDGRSVQISWGADLSRDPDPDISGQCLDYVFCRDFNYELSDGFGPGPYTLECWLTHNDEPYFGPSSWPGPEDEDKKQRCRVRGNNELVAYVVIDGVKSNELRWTQPG